jgi:NAD-dependent SIR2 family protein deacetylase
MIVFTGAGISTSAGVPDFRSGVNTVLDTGAGWWTTLAEERKQRSLGAAASAVPAKAPAKSVDMSKAQPTPTHMALVELQRRGILKYVISQNVDGLHRRSGIPSAQMSELHGNNTVEACDTCHKEYLRDFKIRSDEQHFTGRGCTIAGCGGRLKDTIINFNEDVAMEALQFGFGHAFQADLCVVLGTSCRVRPACDLPMIVHKNGKRVVIINLQSTPLDKMATRINGKVGNTHLVVFLVCRLH